VELGIAGGALEATEGCSLGGGAAEVVEGGSSAVATG
jgi:hypothetical protein